MTIGMTLENAIRITCWSLNTVFFDYSPRKVRKRRPESISLLQPNFHTLSVNFPYLELRELKMENWHTTTSANLRIAPADFFVWQLFA